MNDLLYKYSNFRVMNRQWVVHDPVVPPFSWPQKNKNHDKINESTKDLF